LDLNNSLAQVLSDGSSTYLYGLDRIGQQNIVGWKYYFGDALGSVRQLANSAGTVIQARNYEAFGKQLGAAGNPLTKYGFTGEWTDPTNLIYLRVRYYDPATGRFLSKDPVRGLIVLPGTLNLYTYVSNNPINFYDPTGYNFISDKIKNWLDFFNNHNAPPGTPPPPYRPSQTPGPPTPNINSMFRIPTLYTCSRQSPCIEQAGTSTPTPTPTPTPLPFGVAARQLLDMYQPELNDDIWKYLPPWMLRNPIVQLFMGVNIGLDAYWAFNQVGDYFSSSRPTVTPLLPCMIPLTTTPTP
jgi:RHS repeat-associated protein